MLSRDVEQGVGCRGGRFDSLGAWVWGEAMEKVRSPGELAQDPGQRKTSF